MYEWASVDSLHNSYHCVKKKSIHAFDVHMLINIVDVIWHLKRMQTKDQTVCSWTIMRNIKPCRSLDALRLCVNKCWLAVFRQTHVTIVTKTLTTRPKTKLKTFLICLNAEMYSSAVLYTDYLLVKQCYCL